MSTLPEIAFNKVSVEGSELDHIAEAIGGGHTSSGGPFSQRAADLLRADSGAEDVLLTTSCTSALEMSALLLDLQPGDTVIVPSFTFVSSAVAFVRAGAGIKFCDIEPHTLGPDPRHVAELLDDTVRAIVVVHYAGIVCDMDGLREVLRDRPDVAVIEDNAHGLFGRWRDQPLGSLGRFATLSFHETKNFVCGEGGALVLNDARDVDRAWVLYDKGTNRKAFFQGQVDKYSWRDTGSSFGLSDALAAYLLGQLEQREVIQGKRRAVHERYVELLTPHVERLGLTLPTVPEDAVPAYHLFYLLLPDHDTRTRVMKQMREEGVQTTFHYIPLHDSPAGQKFAVGTPHCPVTTDIAGRLMRLPFHNNLSAEDQQRVVESLVRALA